MLENGWIKLHRSFLRWEWYSDINVSRVYLHLLLTVSIRPQKWRGVEVPRGARIVGLAQLAAETELTVGKVRAALDRLVRAGDITRNTHGKITVITLNHFAEYQDDCNETAENLQQDSSENADTVQEHGNERADSLQQYKKEKKEKKEKKDEKRESTHARTQAPTLAEIQAYCLERSSPVRPERFHAYYEANGWMRHGAPITDWQAVLRLWETQEQQFSAKSSPKSSGTEEMSPAEIEQMNEYLSLVNRFSAADCGGELSG